MTRSNDDQSTITKFSRN